LLDWEFGAKEAKIWVKVPSIPVNGDAKIKKYYGNPSASAVSDGDKVFEFFDDFSRKSLDTDKWIIFGNPKMTFSNSILDISGSCGAGNANGDVLESKKNFNYPLIYEAYYKYDHTPWGNYAGIGLGRYSYPVSTHCAMEVDHSCYDNKGAFEIENGDSIDGCADWVVNDWEKTKIIWTDKFVSFERGSAICTFTASIPSQSMPVHLGDSYFNRNEFIQLYVDWIFIHKYASIEPTLTLSPEHQTPAPTVTPTITPTPAPTPISQEHIKFIVTPLGDGKYNITYTEYAPFTVKILRYSDGKGIAGVPLYQLEPKEIIEASKGYLQQNAPNIIGTQLTERAVTKILEEAGVYVFSGPFGIIIKVFSNLATAVDYLSYLTTPYIDLGAITDNEGKATLYLPNRAYTTTRDMSAFITQMDEPIDQTAPATPEQIAEQIASILLPTIQEELQPIAYKDITLAIPTKITIADEGVVTTETTEELKTYTKFRAINSKTVGNSRELIFLVEPKKIPPTTIGTGKEEEKAMKAHVLSPERHLFPHVVSLSHYFQNNRVNCNYIDLIGYLADISSWEALNSPLESRWLSSEDDFTVVIYSKEDKLNEYHIFYCCYR